VPALPARPFRLALVRTVGDLMTSDVLTVAPEDTIGETAEKMVDLGVSSAVVSDYGRLIGIVTERDLTRAVAGRIHTSEARVREWMTPDPVTLPKDAPAEEAARIMLEQRFRHIPIVEDEHTIGIISIRDVARWGTEEG
jgi:CBS domain-containing protein